MQASFRHLTDRSQALLSPSRRSLLDDTPSLRQALAGAEDTTITGTLTASDEEGLTDNTYFSIASNHAPAKGTASIRAKSGAWAIPNTNYFGSDSFTVTVTDDQGGTTTKAVSLTITNVDPAMISVTPLAWAETPRSRARCLLPTLKVC